MLLHDSEVFISYITEIELLSFHAITEAEEERIEENDQSVYGYRNEQQNKERNNPN